MQLEFEKLKSNWTKKKSRKLLATLSKIFKVKKREHSEEMEIFIISYQLPNLKQENLNILNNPITGNEI